MAEYNFTIENKTSVGYDQLYPATKGEQVDVSEIATDLGLSGTISVNDALKAVYEHGGGGSIPVINITSTDGSTYIGTVPNATSFYAGQMIIVIPDKSSITKAPRLNLNNLGNKNLGVPDTYSTSTLNNASSETWLRKDYPCRLMWSGSFWWAADYARVDSNDLLGLDHTITTGTRKGTNTSTINIPCNSKAEFLMYGSDLGGSSEVLFFVSRTTGSGVKVFYGQSSPVNVSASISWTRTIIQLELSGNYLSTDRCNSSLTDYWYIIFY